MTKLHAAAFFSAALLAACGGGGGGDDTPAEPSAAQGLWTGTTNTSRSVTGLVFSDGTYYVLYSAPDQPGTIAGVVQGGSSASNGAWSSSNARDFNLEGAGVLSASISGSYAAQQTLSGTVTYSSGATTAFSTTYNVAYRDAPTLTALAGTYTGQVALSQGIQAATVTISSSGNITASAEGCSSSGTATPRTDGNAFNITITFGSSPCFFAGQTFTGIAYLDGNTLYAAAPNAGRTDGVLLLATKP